MGKKFTGVWATFEYLDDTCNAIQELRKSGYENLTTHAPCPRHEIDHALGDPQSRVPYFTLISGIIGCFLAFLFIWWTSLDWVLPVSGKAITSTPNVVVIAFELTVLLGAYGTMAGVMLLILKDIYTRAFPKSKEYRGYSRFTRDRFGVVVRCKFEEINVVEDLLNKHQPEEVNSET